MQHKTKHYGWQPDLPDHRDFQFAVRPILLRKLPAQIDLRKYCPKVYDQGQLGSCTANAIGAAFEFEQMKQNTKHDFIPSRLFIYYNERVIEKSVDSDNGAQIRDGIKSINKLGVCDEKIFPYDINKFTHKPSQACYSSALKHQVTSYHRLTQKLANMKGCLAEGYPFVFGFTVYDEFESEAVSKTGKLNMPKSSEQLVGGHAVMAVGYDDKTKRFIVRNSWGNTWGQKGYFTMPYDYLFNNNLADDFWTIRLVEDTASVKKRN